MPLCFLWPLKFNAPSLGIDYSSHTQSSKLRVLPFYCLSFLFLIIIKMKNLVFLLFFYFFVCFSPFPFLILLHLSSTILVRFWYISLLFASLVILLSHSAAQQVQTISIRAAQMEKKGKAQQSFVFSFHPSPPPYFAFISLLLERSRLTFAHLSFIHDGSHLSFLNFCTNAFFVVFTNERCKKKGLVILGGK